LDLATANAFNTVSVRCAPRLDVAMAGRSIPLLATLPSEPITAMSLVVDTVPSGAQARVREGASCITPCELAVTPMGPFMVDFTLKNHEPQSVQVILAALYEADPSGGIRLDPNPLIVPLTANPATATSSQAEARRQEARMAADLRPRSPAGILVQFPVASELAHATSSSLREAG
jgi:hypothetical protein